MALWVSLTELQAYLIAARIVTNPMGINDPFAFLPLEDALLAAQNEFEIRTGWQPFVWNGLAETRQFDAEGQKLLDLQGGLLRIDSVNVGTSVFDTGSYWLGPPNAAARGLAYTYIELWRTAIYFPGSVPGKLAISVTGDWGRVYELPPKVKLGVMGGAAAFLMPALSIARTGGAISLKENDEEVKFAENPFGAAQSSLMLEFDKAVSQWKRAKLS